MIPSEYISRSITAARLKAQEDMDYTVEAREVVPQVKALSVQVC